MIQEPVPVEVLEKPKAEIEEVETLKLDLGCGQAPKLEGWKGVDKVPTDQADYVCDLSCEEWPFEESSVDEARAIHLYEHFDGMERIHFMNELWRVLKPNAGCMIVCPAPWSDRALQDPTHKWPPVVAPGFFYFNADWRKQNGLTHGDYFKIVCNFDFNSQGIPGPLWSHRNEETKQFSAVHYVNAMVDLHVLAIARKP